jgi:LRR receptor-like serine/threonine-protein kinase FLS2
VAAAFCSGEISTNFTLRIMCNSSLGVWTTMFFLFCIFFVELVYMLRRHQESNLQVPSLLNILPVFEHRMISYQELCQGTNYFCESNLLGTGGFGSVYKWVLFDGTIVAIKVLNLQLSSVFKRF